MVTIPITAEALVAIAATLPDNREAERRPDGNGSFLVPLDHRLLDRLKAMGGPGESYSYVIVRLAGGGAEARADKP